MVVAASAIEDLCRRPAHPGDLEAARSLPAWRATESLAARALLRQLLGEVLGPAAADSRLAARAGGQPELAVQPDVGVSLSHTDGWVAAAVHVGGAVGVDVQAPVPASDRIVRRCCTPSARAVLAGLDPAERDSELAWIWSVQEACVKAAGLGIAGRPCVIPVEVGQRAGRWRAFQWRALRGAWPIPVSCAFGHRPEPPCLRPPG